MTTKFNIGDEVFIKATVEEIAVYRREGKDEIKYKVDIDNSIGVDVCGRAVAREDCLLSASNIDTLPDSVHYGIKRPN